MVQLQAIVSQMKSKLDDGFTTLKKNLSSTALDPDEQGTSSCSPEGTQPNDSERASKLIDSVMTTLFSACTGNQCPPSNDDKVVESMQKKQPTKLGKKARSALQTLQRTSSRDECHYAQFYEDDHGRAARAVLMVREREGKERIQQRQRMNELHQKARLEARTSISPGQKKGPTVPQHRETVPQHRENIQVGGTPYRLYEVGSPLNRSGASEEEVSVMSYNFDDGISALSAHTLEDMAKAELILQRKYGVPKEQGFDITLGSTAGADLPPSRTGTVESSNASDDVVETEKDNVAVEKYPVQMARPRSHRSNGSASGSIKSDHSEWKTHEQKYWVRVVENCDGPDESVSAWTHDMHLFFYPFFRNLRHFCHFPCRRLRRQRHIILTIHPRRVFVYCLQKRRTQPNHEHQDSLEGVINIWNSMKMMNMKYNTSGQP